MAAGLESLENFVKTTRSGRASFTQVVTSPPKEGAAPRSKTSSGSFEFQRPGRFRFAYQKPFEQSIVADGQTLWMYDVDLNQVTARKQSQVLGSTPAALIAAAPDLKALQADFALAGRRRQGWACNGCRPRRRPKTASCRRCGWVCAPRIKGSELAVLDILDSFGQRSVLTFTGFVLNPAFPADAFQFKPPAGADVIRQ